MKTWGTTRSDGTTVPSAGRYARRDDRSERERARQLLLAKPSPEVEAALSSLPSVVAVMTAAHEHRRAGLIVSRIMRCGDAPACVAVAVRSGQRLSMLIRDSRVFGLCVVDPSNRLLMKKFGDDPSIVAGDPFDALPTRTLVSGVPLLVAGSVCLDCEVVRHVDLDGDHELYVGLVLGAMIRGQAASTAEADAVLGQLVDGGLKAGQASGVGMTLEQAGAQASAGSGI